MSTVPHVPQVPLTADVDAAPIPLRTGGPAGAVLAGSAVMGLVVVLAITVAGRVLRAPPVALAVAVMVLPYLYAGLGLYTFAAWVLLPDRKLLPAVLAVATLVAAGLWGPAWADRGESFVEGSEPLRVMSWNVRRLWGHPDAEADALACVAHTIDKHQPDVLTLLEASRHDVDLLSDQLGLQCVHGTYRLSRSRRIGGLATCVRGDRWVLQSGGPQRFVDHEDWHYLFAEVARGEHVINVLAVHLSPYGVGTPDEVARRQSGQTAALLRRVERFRDPTILAGDFNSTRDASVHVSLRKSLTDAWERGATGLGETIRAMDVVPMRVDYVYVTDQIAVHETASPPTTCSDHRPVITTLSLRAPTGAPPADASAAR